MNPAPPALAHESFGDGDPVLFLHGFLLSRALWTPVARSIAEARPNRWRCIAPDLRGFGESPPIDPWSIADHADDCARLLDVLAPRTPAVVVGLSMGGIIAMEFLARHRHRVRAIALVDCRVEPNPPGRRDFWESMARTALTEGPLAAGGSMLDAAFAPSAPDHLRSAWRDILARTSPLGVAAGAIALADRADHRPTLATVTTPAIVICGDQDTITPPEHMRGIAGAIPDASFTTIPNAGHMSPVENPGALHETLTQFLDRIPIYPQGVS